MEIASIGLGEFEMRRLWYVIIPPRRQLVSIFSVSPVICALFPASAAFAMHWIRDESSFPPSARSTSAISSAHTHAYIHIASYRHDFVTQSQYYSSPQHRSSTQATRLRDFQPTGLERKVISGAFHTVMYEVRAVSGRGRLEALTVKYRIRSSREESAHTCVDCTNRPSPEGGLGLEFISQRYLSPHGIVTNT
ncbi:hypothetical protein RRG08_033545 [Elysia crispata]|uniref:Uncharacterized protein n=1 Tax=Elysia crispata TaxID=231223 RepID=A0AAE1CJQ3_9GAST|nr:hypothetical protein RRG08_033545 [Elysia crispata]